MSLVSVCIPCHNSERFIGAAIESVLAQTYKHLEIIVVNDGSTDKSVEVISRYLGNGVRIIDANCGNASKARNIAFQNSRGDYIKFFDSDDLISPRMIEHQYARIRASTDCVSFSGWGRFYRSDISDFKPNYEPIWRDMDSREWLVEAWMNARPMMQPGQFLIPRDLVLNYGGWNESLTLTDDFEFFARILSNAEQLLFSDGCFLLYRSGISGSLSRRSNRASVVSAMESILGGTDHLLKVHLTEKSKLACCNMLQQFVYMYYPRFRDLTKIVESRIDELGGSNLNPSGSPKFEACCRVVGWRLSRWIQSVFDEHRNNK
jgi:glycosyltransferase involved in cell wall biosynthesis